jgi:hypothetical protein
VERLVRSLQRLAAARHLSMRGIERCSDAASRCDRCTALRAAVPAFVDEPQGKVELMAQLQILTDYAAHVERELK